MVIEDLASEILAEVTAVTSPSQLSFVALAMKTDLQSDDRLHARTIQLRTKDKIYIFDVGSVSPF
jgi:predicted nucleic acid-binding protein